MFSAVAQSLAESMTEAEFNRHWDALDDDGIWSAHPNLSDYVYNQWVKDGKYKVCTGSCVLAYSSCRQCSQH